MYNHSSNDIYSLRYNILSSIKKTLSVGASNQMANGLVTSGAALEVLYATLAVIAHLVRLQCGSLSLEFACLGICSGVVGPQMYQ